jgi:hypothetical protein
MDNKRSWPVKLNVEIEPESLKRVVEEGRLLEFVDAFSTYASLYIKAQVVEELAKAGVGLTKVGGGIIIAGNFDVDDPYRTGPIPWPWPRGGLGGVNFDRLRQVIRDEVGNIG